MMAGYHPRFTPASWIANVSRFMRRERSALAALEFALVAPLLSALLVGAVATGQLLYDQLRLAAAVHAGADYAMANQSSVSSTHAAALAATVAQIIGNMNGPGWASGVIVVNNGPSITFSSAGIVSGGSADDADRLYCLSGSPGQWNWNSSISDGSQACDEEDDGPRAGKFVTITAYHTFDRNILGMLFAGRQLTQNAVVQVQ